MEAITSRLRGVLGVYVSSAPVAALRKAYRARRLPLVGPQALLAVALTGLLLLATSPHIVRLQLSLREQWAQLSSIAKEAKVFSSSAHVDVQQAVVALSHCHGKEECKALVNTLNEKLLAWQHKLHALEEGTAAVSRSLVVMGTGGDFSLAAGGDDAAEDEQQQEQQLTVHGQSKLNSTADQAKLSDADTGSNSAAENAEQLQPERQLAAAASSAVRHFTSVGDVLAASMRLFERATADFGNLLLGYTTLAAASTLSNSAPLALVVLQLNVLVGTLCLKLQQVDHALDAAANNVGNCVSTVLSGLRWSNKQQGQSEQQQQQVEQLLMLTKLQLMANSREGSSMGIKLGLPLFGVVTLSTVTLLSLTATSAASSAAKILTAWELDAVAVGLVKAAARRLFGQNRNNGRLSLETGETLYDKLGREEGIEAAVIAFYKNVLRDPELAPFFQKTNMEFLKKKLSSFMCAAFGGPQQFTGQSLRDAHMPMIARCKLNRQHYDMVLGHLLGTLQGLHVQPEVIAQVAAAVSPLREVFKPANLSEKLSLCMRVDAGLVDAVVGFAVQHPQISSLFGQSATVRGQISASTWPLLEPYFQGDASFSPLEHSSKLARSYGPVMASAGWTPQDLDVLMQEALPGVLKAKGAPNGWMSEVAGALAPLHAALTESLKQQQHLVQPAAATATEAQEGVGVSEELSAAGNT